MQKQKPLYKFENKEQCGNCEYYSAYHIRYGTFFALAEKGICQRCGKEKKGSDVCSGYRKRNLSQQKSKDAKQLIKSLTEIQSMIQQIMLESECKSKEFKLNDERLDGTE